MTQYARTERQALADLLLATGPDAPTLCDGWTTRDLAAHLVTRDRRPDAIVATVVPRLAAHGEAVRRGAQTRGYTELVGQVRNPPWWSPLSNPLTHEWFNAAEYFIHHEDVRRAVPDWQPRLLPAAHAAVLWRTTWFTARLALRRLHVPVVVRAPGHGEVSVGTGEPQASLVADPGELALFLSGRQRAALVDVDGVPAVVDRLRRARLGI